MKVFDSLYASVDKDTRSTILNLFQIEGLLKLNIVKTQTQEGGDDCGLFAIATATALAFGTDPSSSDIRAHLFKCFEGRHDTFSNHSLSHHLIQLQ